MRLLGFGLKVIAAALCGGVTYSLIDHPTAPGFGILAFLIMGMHAVDQYVFEMPIIVVEDVEEG